MIGRADQALYRAKRRGRDRVEVDGGEPGSGHPKSDGPASRPGTTCLRCATSSWRGSSTRSRTCWRSRASWRSRSAPIGGRPIPSPTAPIDVVAAYRAGTPPRLEGVGKAIDEKLAELADTGRLRYHEQLLAQGAAVAGDLAARARHRPPHGRRPVARAGHRHARGPGARPRARGGCARSRASPPRPSSGSSTGSRSWRRGRPSRMHMAEAPRRGGPRWRCCWRRTRASRAVTAAGSVRRGRETVGDLDLLVETDQPAEVLAAVRTMAAVGAGRGRAAGRRAPAYRCSCCAAPRRT